MSMKTVCFSGRHKLSFYRHMALLLAALVSLSAAAPLNDTLCKDMQPAKFQVDNSDLSAVNAKHLFSAVNTFCGSKVKLSLMEESVVSAIQLDATSSSLESRRPIKIRVYLMDAIHEVMLEYNKSNATISISSPLSAIDTIVIHSTPPTCLKSRVWECMQPAVRDNQETRSKSAHPQFHHIRRRAAATAVKRNRDSGDATFQTYSWLPFMMAGVFSVALLAILPALFAVSICCHSKSRKKRTQDKALIVRESLPFNSKNNPMKARRESQRNGESRYEVDPLGEPTISTFHDQKSSIDKRPLDNSSIPLEYTLFSTSLSKSPPNTVEHQTSSLSHSPVHRVSMVASEHVSVSSFAPKHTPTHTGHPNHSISSSHIIHSQASHPGSRDSHPIKCSTITVVPRSTEKRHRNTDSYSSNASGISYNLTGARLSELSDLSVSGPPEGDITPKQTQIVSTGQQNTTTEGETTAASRMTESNESNPIVTQRRPTFTVKVYQHVEKTPEAGMDVTLQSSMTTLLTSSTSQAEVRLFSEGDTIDNGFETSLDKGKRSVVPKPTKGGAATKQHHVTPSKDAKKKKHTKKNLKKKAPISPPRSPPPLPPLPPLPVAPPTTDVQSETEREAGKKSRAQTPIAAKTIEIHTPTNKLHNKVATLSPPNTPPPLPPLPPLPTTPLAYQFQNSVSSAQKPPDMIITCSNCGQEIKESRNDSPHSSPKTNNVYSSDKLPLKRKKTGPPYHILESGSAICMECLMKDGPIYHELETPSDEEALDDVATSPPIPSRDYPPPPPKPQDPVYERVGSLSKKYPPEGLLPAIEENSITRSRKPKSLVLRTGSSTDYESIPSLNSPNYHRAEQFSQLATRYPGHRTLPPLHLQLPAHAFMEDMLESNEQHDYESLTSIANEQHIAVNMGAMGERRGSHDYACIGAAPSMEDLPSPDSPPFVPEGAKRVQLLKIDSQGYASVMPLQDDEIDCLTFSEKREQCALQLELPVCSENDMWKYQQDPGYAPLVPRRESGGSTQSQGNNIVPSAIPQDYEVPVHCLPSIEQTSRRNSHVLTRQRALTPETSTEDDQSKRLSHQRASDVGTHYLESDHDLEDTEEVFDDSGIETSVDSQDQVLKEKKRWNQHSGGSEVKISARASSLGNTGTVVEMNESYHRPRAITLHNVKFRGEDKDQGERPISTALRISLDQTSQAVV